MFLQHNVILLIIAAFSLGFYLRSANDQPLIIQIKSVNSDFKHIYISLKKWLLNPLTVVCLISFLLLAIKYCTYIYANQKYCPSLKTFNGESFEVLREDNEFDLSNWKHVDEKDKDKKISQEVKHIKLKIKKKSKDAKFIYRFISAQSNISPDIIMHSDHKYYFCEKVDSIITYDKPTDYKHYLFIDVDSIPVGTIFEVEYSIRYWNSARLATEDFSGTIVTCMTDTLNLIVVPPNGADLVSPFKSIISPEKEIKNLGAISLENNKLVWQIIKPKMKYNYKINWVWKE